MHLLFSLSQLRDSQTSFGAVEPCEKCIPHLLHRGRNSLAVPCEGIEFEQIAWVKGGSTQGSFLASSQDSHIEEIVLPATREQMGRREDRSLRYIMMVPIERWGTGRRTYE